MLKTPSSLTTASFSTLPSHITANVLQHRVQSTSKEVEQQYPDLTAKQHARIAARELAKLNLPDVCKDFYRLMPEALREHPEIAQAAMGNALINFANAEEVLIRAGYRCEHADNSPSPLTQKAVELFTSALHIGLRPFGMSANKFMDVIKSVEIVSNDPSKKDLLTFAIDFSMPESASQQGSNDEDWHAFLVSLAPRLIALLRNNRAMKINLDLSNNHLVKIHDMREPDGKQFDDRGLQHFLAVLAQLPPLHGLNISRNHLGDRGLQALAEAVQRLPLLTSLNVNGNKENTDTGSGIQALIAAIARSGSKVTSLELARCQIGVDQMKLLVAALSRPGCRVTSLDLSHCCFQHNELKALAAALPDTGLVSLDLSHGFINDTDAQLLAETLPHTKVERLNLSGNYIGSAGRRALASVMESHPNIKILGLDIQEEFEGRW